MSIVTWLGALRHSVAGMTMLFLLALLTIGAIVIVYEGIVALVKLVGQE